MLVNVDAKQLEVICAAYLSKDKVLYDEIRNEVDIHTANQERFKLPTRLIAKTFKFRLIYGGSAYSYANDPDFSEVSTNEKYWQNVINEYYEKYVGLGEWHTNLITIVTSTGRLVMPTGRIYNFKSEARRGDIVWPRTKILNYPVQGLGADLMAIARVSAFRRFKDQRIEGVLISTIHDSIVADVESHEVERTCQLFHDVFEAIPLNFKRVFDVEFDLPTRCEISYGPDKFNLIEAKPRASAS